MSSDTDEQSWSVLLVDDDLVDCRGIARLIADKGLPLRLTTANSLADARRSIADGSFDVALLDHELGDGTGLDLLSQLGETATIILTGAGSEQLAADALRLQASHYMIKDTDGAYLHLLPAVIKDALDRRWTRAELRRHAKELENEIERRRRVERELQLLNETLEGRVAEQTRELSRANQALQLEIAETKRVQALQARMAAILDATTDFVCIRDPQQRALYLNRGGRKLMGIGESEDLSEFKIAAFRPGSENHCLQRTAIQTALRDGIWSGETVFLRRDGREIPMSQVLIAHKNAAGEVECLSSIARDVTERKKAEEALARSEERYRLVVTTMAEGIMLQNERGEILECNPNAERILGLTAAQVQHRHLRDPKWAIIREDGTPLAIDEYPTAVTLRTGKTYQYEIFGIQHPDGRLTWISVHTQPIHRGGDAAPQGVLLSFHDVTSLKNAMAELQAVRAELEDRVSARTADLSTANEQLLREKARLRQIIDLVPAMVFARDAHGKLLLVNRAFAAECGVTVDDLMTAEPVSLPILHALLAAPADDRAVVATGRAKFIPEEAVGGLNGKVGYFQTTKIPFESDSAEAGAVLTVSVDVTHRKEAEEQVQRHRAELAHIARLSTMGELATGLAHEINQPLCAITNYARGSRDRLRAGRFDVGEICGAIEKVLVETERAVEIIRRLRRFVEKRGPKRSTVHLNELIRDVVQLFAAELRLRQVAVELRLAEDLPALIADSVQIQQVIVNLIRNGFESLEESPLPRRIAVETRFASRSEAQCVVRDNGAGFSPDGAARVFEPFFTTKRDGLGMGLSISRSIIEAHGGRLRATPGQSGGAEFCFTLPFSIKESLDAI